MSTTMENLRQDVHKAPEQLEREADSARSAVEGTLAELEQRLSPGQMLDRVMDMVKRHGGEFGDNLLVQVRNNPLPTIMAGVGMAWLMGASKRPPPRGPERSYDGERSYRGNGNGSWRSSDATRDAAARAVDATRDAAHSAADATRDAAHSAADATRGAAQRAASATRETFDTVAEASRAGARGVSEGYTYLFREQPLVLGAIAIAVGAALGALLPSTSTEDRLIGETSDEAKAHMKSEAKARADDLGNAASRAVDEMEDAAASAVDTMEDELSASDETSSDESMDNPALRTGPGQVDGSV